MAEAFRRAGSRTTFETYTVTAYWLRERMGKVDEAEQFLREGLRENPDSYEFMLSWAGLCREQAR